MNPIQKLINKITLLTCCVGLVIFLLGIWFVDIKTLLISLVLAILMSLIGFNVIVYSTANIQKMKANSYIYYLLRLIIYGLTVYLAIQFNLDIVVVIMGLLSTKIAVVIYGFLEKGGL